MLTDQQQEAVISVDQNVLVSAGAGSGKTHVLVERYVEILRKNPAITLANIIAVTFTRKAASEMRSRLKAKFLFLSKDAGELEKGNYMRWLNCLSEVDSARIGTIHSLCESIIRAYPADSGIDPEFEALDELTRSELSDESVTQALRDVINAHENGDGETTFEYALLIAFSIDEVKDILCKLVDKSMQFDQALAVMPELTSEAFFAHAQKFINQVQMQELAALSCNRAFKQAFDYVRANPHADPKNALESSRQLVISLCQHLFSGGGDEKLHEMWQALVALAEHSVGNVGGTKPEAKELRAQLKVLRTAATDATAKVPAGLGPEDSRAIELASGIVQLYKRAQAHYQARKEKMTALDFNDLISRARTALEREGSQARAYFNDKVKALLVDEFQDTNDVQADLLTMLAGAETRVFFIGDDKQSIYKFQGADVATFNRWKLALANQTTALAGTSKITKLNRSFRSHPGVVAFVNDVFAKLLNGDPEVLPYVAAFEALEPARQMIQSTAKQAVAAGVTIEGGESGCASEGATSVTVKVVPESGPVVDVVLYNKDEGAPAALAPDQLEAAHVAHWIKTKVEGGHLIDAKGGGTRPMQYGDFAVLVSKNADFRMFEEVFPRAGIPYVASGGKGFLRRQEVTDFENLLRFLDNPNDSHSLLAVLRSPLCPLTDDIIHKIATGGAMQDEAETKRSSMPLWVLLTEAASRPMTEGGQGGMPSVKQAVRLLRTILDYASLLPLGELVHKIITLTRYDLVLLAADDGRQRSRNVWKIAHMARENEDLTCGEFAHKIADMRDFGMKEQEAPLDSSNAVKLMTVHASKGLEFPAVALPCLGGKLNKNADRFIFHQTYGVALNTKRLKEDEVPAWHRVASHFDSKMEAEERKRLLYVAMTRARDCLGLFIRHEARNDESYRLWLLDNLGLKSHDLSLPDVGQSIVLNVPGIAAGTGGGATRAAFSLSYWFGFPPLDLSAPPAGALPSPLTPLESVVDEPVMDVFKGQVNELAMVRLTPPTRDAENHEFSITDPRVIGTFFHALMENLPRFRRVDRDWVRDIANNQGFHFVHPRRLEAFVDEGVRLLEIYYGSNLRELVEGAHSTFNEMPYWLSDGDWIATKRPDLILEAGDGQWYLIDYKTDHFHPSQLAAQVRRHKDQLEGYVKDLRLISGIDLKAALYFAQTGSIEYII